jgi:hypothetical protein
VVADQSPLAGEAGRGARPRGVRLGVVLQAGADGEERGVAMGRRGGLRPRTRRGARAHRPSIPLRKTGPPPPTPLPRPRIGLACKWAGWRARAAWEPAGWGAGTEEPAGSLTLFLQGI